MKTIILIAALAAVLAATQAHAGSHQGGTREFRSYQRAYQGGSGSVDRTTDEFRTFHCKTQDCWNKHPDGTWVHPLTARKDGS
jgi:hypothetical protein